MGLQEIKYNITDYLKGVKAEWGKITWPTKHQIGTETVAVIIIVISFTIFILLLDIVFKWFFGLIRLG